MGIASGIVASGGTTTTDATAEQWHIKSGKTAYIASGKVTGTGYFPAAMDFDGSTGYYSDTYTSSGNKVSALLRFKVASKAALQVLAYSIVSGNARLFAMLRASNDATVERRDKLLILVFNSSGANILNIVTNASLADDQWHTAFIDFDADAGTAQMVVDGASDINTGAAAHLITTGALSSGAGTTVCIGSQNGTNFCDGLISSVGLRDTAGLTASDFMQTDGTPKPLDVSTWAEWGAQPVIYHESAKLDESLGSAGAMTKNGTINLASASDWS